MTSHQLAVVWLDHREARIFHVDCDGFDERVLRAPTHHLHHNPEDTRHFFDEVARSLDDAGAVLVVGPSTAKLQYLRWLHAHDRHLECRVVGVESADHPTDLQIVAHARQYFDVARPRIR